MNLPELCDVSVKKFKALYKYVNKQDKIPSVLLKYYISFSIYSALN